MIIDWQTATLCWVYNESQYYCDSATNQSLCVIYDAFFSDWQSRNDIAISLVAFGQTLLALKIYNARNVYIVDPTSYFCFFGNDETDPQSNILLANCYYVANVLFTGKRTDFSIYSFFPFEYNWFARDMFEIFYYFWR